MSVIAQVGRREERNKPTPEPRLPGVLRTVPAGSDIFSQGQPFTGLYQIVRGSVLLFTIDSSQQETVVKVARAGEIIGGFASLDFGPHGTSARALIRTALLFVSAEELRRALPGESRSVAELLLGRFARSMLDRVVLLSRTNVLERLMAFMAAHAEPDPYGGAWVQLPETRAQIAAELATTRETVSRALARLRRDGIVEGDGSRLYVRDIRALRWPLPGDR